MLLTVALAATFGCRSTPSGGGAVSAGPYLVRVVDAMTGRGIEDAVVEWDMYFTSEAVDPAQRANFGLDVTGADGAVKIASIPHPPGDTFRELKLTVTVAGYVEAKRTVKETGGEITIELAPIEPTMPRIETE